MATAMTSMSSSGPGGGGIGGSGPGAAASSSNAASTMTSVITSSDPAAMLHQRLASALSTMGDAQYWEESISPAQIRGDLEKYADPLNPSNIQYQLKCMKWLLANISKGRDVSDFYTHVIKLVGAASLEVRKMVYMFTVQYANHNAETRELSLLSINAFQRGLADPEPLIRGLALRVLTSIHLNDILQIQILAVQTCAADASPYVRKCAANAVAKLAPRCSNDATQTDLLMEIIQDLLDKDTATMVLTSALTAFSELTIANQNNADTFKKKKKKNAETEDDDSSSSSSGSSSSSSSTSDDDDDCFQLHRLHGSFRKICHLLTDMDEWGQVVVIDLLARYCRQFFARPVNLQEGTAERIDRERRVRRPDYANYSSSSRRGRNDSDSNNTNKNMNRSKAEQAAAAGVTLPPRNTARKVKRRVVKKGFYSDEEDESTEEEVYVTADNNSPGRNSGLPVAAALRQRNVLGVNIDDNNNNNNTQQWNSNSNKNDSTEDDELAPDHRLLLQSVLPLLKSRNAGVVLAVCSLHYYCGVASVAVRSAMGKALVRIVHTAKDRREIQYVILSSIRQLVSVCPSAFAPYMSDFFVHPNQDPPFTRRIKLDILVQLALEPAAIDAVLQELRTYVRLPATHKEDDVDEDEDEPYVEYNNIHDDEDIADLDDDTQFAVLSIRAVGRVVEMTRIVFDRHAATTSGSSSASERAEANRIALNCLYGLITLSETSAPPILIGETVSAMQRILQLLHASEQHDERDPFTGETTTQQQEEQPQPVHDPNHVQERAFRRILLLLVHTLNALYVSAEEQVKDDDDDDEDRIVDPSRARLERVCGGVVLPAKASAAAIALVGTVLTAVESTRNTSNYQAAFGNLLSSANNNNNSNNRMSQFRLEIARLLSRAFLELTAREKEQAIHYASKVLVSNKDSPAAGFSPQEISLCEHILAMGRVDVNPDVRDRARFESNIIHLSIGLQFDTDAMEDAGNIRNMQTATNLLQMGSGNEQPTIPTSGTMALLSLEDARNIFLSAKPASSSLPLEHDDTNDTGGSKNKGLFDDQSGVIGGFRFGTLSSLVGHRARSAYIPLPAWAGENSPDSLRDPPQEKRLQQQNQTTITTPSSGGDAWGNRNATQKAGKGFYEDDSSSADDGSSSSSESGDDDSENESESSSSSSSTGSGDDSSTSGAQNDDTLIPGVGTAARRQVMPVMSSNTTPSFQPKMIPNVKVESASDDSSSSSDSDDDSSSNRKKPNIQEMFPSVGDSGFGNLIPVGGGGVGGASKRTSYAGNDLQGLVLAPTPVDSAEPTDANFDRDSSPWMQMVRPEHAGGLSVHARYLRGVTKAQQAQLMGFAANKTTVVCLQFRFENKKTDNASLRRIRILQRSSAGSSGSAIGPRKVISPPEIMELGFGQKTECVVGIDFVSVADREGSLVAKLDVKFGTGGMPIEIKPSIADLLLPSKMTVEEFDTAINRMQGFQRLEADFVSSESMKSQLPQKLHSCASFTAVGGSKLKWKDDQIRLTGNLPASSDPVYAVIRLLPSGKGKIIVCCDHALAVNTIMNILKRVVADNN